MYTLASQVPSALGIAFMEGNEGEILANKENPAGFSCLLRYDQALLIDAFGALIITTKTGYFSLDVQRLCHPWLMIQFAEQRQTFLNERYGGLRFSQHRVAQESEG